MDDLLVCYDSFTGNTEKFAHKLPYKCCHISDYDGISPFILVTYTINFGQIPETTKLFMNNHYKNCMGVSSSGNKNWGSSYGKAANKISKDYKIPLISKFELQGNKEDIQNFIEGVYEVVRK